MTRSRKFTACFTLALAAPLLAAPIMADAAPKHCPPGHAKKGWCSPGKQGYHPSFRDRNFRHIRDYDRYGLRRPRDGYFYGEIDGEVFLLLEATREIVEGLGAASYLLKR